jgi:hypothetical protein
VDHGRVGLKCDRGPCKNLSVTYQMNGTDI